MVLVDAGNKGGKTGLIKSRNQQRVEKNTTEAQWEEHCHEKINKQQALAQAEAPITEIDEKRGKG